MRIRTLLFASYRELLGTGEMTLSLPGKATVADLVEELRSRGEPFSRLPDDPVVAVNRKYASPQDVLREGDEVALIPPVAGG